MVGLLLHASERERLGAGGRQRVAERFSVPAMVAGNLRIYQEVAGARELADEC